MLARYFDNAASTPVDPLAFAEMEPFLRDECGNAHSAHSFGMRAEAAVELARARVGELLGAESSEEIHFCSGSTEANNWVISAFQGGCVSPIEHASVLESAMRNGYTVLPYAKPAEGDYKLVCIMRVNNETGALYGGPGAREHDFWNVTGPRLEDLTQAAGKLPVDLAHEDIAFATLSAHKLYGPKGVGALYVKGGKRLKPLIVGGGQEHGFRSGTLNVPGIVGMGAAAAIAAERREADFAHAAELKAVFLGELESVSDWQCNGVATSPFICSLSFAGIVGESIVVELDSRGFAVSSTSACSSKSGHGSRVLSAMGVDPCLVAGSIRVSFGRRNTAEATRELGGALRETVENLRKLRK